MDVGQFATPCLFDLDGDGDLDLLAGEKNGYIHLYENLGLFEARTKTCSHLRIGVAGEGLLWTTCSASMDSPPLPSWTPRTAVGWWSAMNWGTCRCLPCPSIPWRRRMRPGPKSTDPWNGWAEGEFAAPPWADLDADGADLVLGIRDGGITLWHSRGGRCRSRLFSHRG